MIKINYQRIMLGFMVIIFGCMLPSSSSPPSTPIRLEELEEELVTILLDSIIHEINVRSLEVKYLIVWSPVQGCQESVSIMMNIEEPIKVWFYEGDQLTEATDPIRAIEQYQQENMTADIYGLYDLGVLSIAEDGQMAEVYMGFDCGVLCDGHAAYYYLERNALGQWEKTGPSVYIIE
jgi:hypothetical protein